MRAIFFIVGLLFFFFFMHSSVTAQPGFLSLDCGGNESYTDNSTGIIWQPDSGYISVGANTSIAKTLSNITNSRPLQRLRSFPFSGKDDDNKFCYLLPVNASQRYLVRATFLYGNYDGTNTAPAFHIHINVTHWSNVVIEDVKKQVFEEMIVLSTGLTLQICIVKGSAGTPFISTLELRQLVGAMYSLPYELTSHLKHIVRVNFGALTTAIVRYPDDPVDRIWESDLSKPNNLAHEAEGTVRIRTVKPIGLSAVGEKPPETVLRTAVMGSLGNITYRFLIPEFPAFVFARTYFAEIQDLTATDVRAFTFTLPNDIQYRGQVVNLFKDIGAYEGYGPGYDNVSLNTIVSFAFQKTSYATLGPLLNAMEILKIVPKQAPTHSDDVRGVTSFAQEFGLYGEGDPCLPVGWQWITCSQQLTARITGLFLAGRNLSGIIPSGISSMTSLTELHLNNNSLTGPIPDMSQLINLKNVHLENNLLDGEFPQSFGEMNSLQQLYVQNNKLTGSVPQSLLTKPGLDFQHDGNPGLCISGCSRQYSKPKTIAAIVGGVLGGVVLTLAVVAAAFFLYKRKQVGVNAAKSKAPDQDSFASMISHHQKYGSSDSGNVIVVQEAAGSEAASHFHFEELREASNNLSKQIGAGGFGKVYYGKLKNEKEIAIKVLSTESNQGAKEFSNEVTLLSRIHHKNLVSFLGYCEDGKDRMLVYEYMHNGTLRDHLHDPKEHMDWVTRLKVVLDAARGLDYLHTGCSPSIIHRDVKSSNILIDSKWGGKVADFGLSKMTSGETSVVSTTVRGTVGYLDPEYYMTQRLTEKSDVFSFGIVLLELISAKEPLNPELFLPESNIVQCVRGALQKGDIESIVDPKLGKKYKLESMWKVSEIGMYCVEPHGVKRPSMSEVVRELQEAYAMETSKPKDHSSSSTSSLPPAAAATAQHYGGGEGEVEGGGGGDGDGDGDGNGDDDGDDDVGSYHLEYAAHNPNMRTVFDEPNAR